MNSLTPQGSLTALVTPFKGDDIDERAFGDFVEWQIEQATEGLVVCGLAGEGPTLSGPERERLVRTAVAAAAGRRPVIVATGSNSTAKTVAMTSAAQRAGANYALIVTPYYNKPSQEGLFRHFAAVAAAVDLPFLVDNAGERTGVSVAPATIDRLETLPNFIGVVGPLGDMAAHPPGRHHHFSLARFSANDRTAVSDSLLGAVGCVSAVANVYPGACSAIQEAGRRGDFGLAAAMSRQLGALFAAFDLEPEPVAVKYAVSRLRPGFSPMPRLPLVPVTAHSAERIEAALAHLCDTPDSFAGEIANDRADLHLPGCRIH